MSREADRPTSPIRRVTLAVAAVLLGLLVTPALVSPAHACSCATPSDIQTWVDESEAAFVGTFLEKRDAGNGSFGQESIYVLRSRNG